MITIQGLIARLPDPLALACGLLIAGFLLPHLLFPTRPIGRFICQTLLFAGFTAMLGAGGVVPTEPTKSPDWTLAILAVSLLKIVWWLSASWLLSGFVRAILVYKREPRETRLLQDLVSAFFYITALLGIIAYVFDKPVSGLLAASGVIAIILGLALQSTLGDVFSGIVLNLAKPYHPGDWVTLDGSLAGRVVETNWRATKILTKANDTAVIPNSIIAKARLINATTPTSAHGVSITVRLDPIVTPSRICSVLQTALLSGNEILQDPPAIVSIRGLDAQALECEIQFFVAAIELGDSAANEVFDIVFRHCGSAGIRLAPPASSGFALPARAIDFGSTDMPHRLLEHIPIFAPLSEAERIALATKMTRRTYMAGDVLVAKGAVAKSLYILASGVLVALQELGGSDGEVVRLSPGDCFGQGGVLAGAAANFKVAALTRSVVYEIAKEDLAPILKERPSIAADLGQILARRVAMGKSRLEEIAVPDSQGETLAARLGDRVKFLFGLKK